MTRHVQPYVTPRRASFATFCRVDIWPEQRERWDRVRYARQKAGYERAKDAADSLGIKAGTYRTYERDPADGGREPPLSEIQRMARKFKVSWIWLATGDGDPKHDILTDERNAAIAKKRREVDPEKEDDAFAAVMGVLDAFARRAG